MKLTAPPLTPARWALAAFLGLLLFGLGTAADPIFAFLTHFWQALFQALGLGALLGRVAQGTSTEVTLRSPPAVATYAALYLALCLLLLRVLLPGAAHWRLALRLYAAVLALIVALVLVGKLGGDVVWLYKVARRLIDFLVSPLPVILLVLVLRSPLGRSARENRTP